MDVWADLLIVVVHHTIELNLMDSIVLGFGFINRVIKSLVHSVIYSQNP